MAQGHADGQGPPGRRQRRPASFRIRGGLGTRGAALALLAALAAGCSAPGAGTETLVVLGTTDVHGWLLGWDYELAQPSERGLARLQPLVDSIRGAHPGATLLVDSGDLLQGNPLTAIAATVEGARDHPVIAAMNLLGYDAAAVGNHEFNFGLPVLDTAFAGADFPFLAANLERLDGGRGWDSWVLVDRELGGRPIRIGLIGLTTPGVLIWDRDKVQGRLSAEDPSRVLARLVPEVRDAGADLVVVAWHGGLGDGSYDAAVTGIPPEGGLAEAIAAVPGIDLVLMGHTHLEVADTTIGGALVQQAGARASSLAVATFELRPEGDGAGWTVVSKRGTLLRGDPERSGAALEERLREAHLRTLEWVDAAVATTSEVWSAADARVRDNALIDLIHEVQLRETGAQLSAASAFNPDAVLGPGSITQAQLVQLYPYDNNTLVAVRIDGASVRAYLEKSAEYFLPCPEGECPRLIHPEVPGYNFDILEGVGYTLDLTRPVGDRVTRLEFEGRPVAPDDPFVLALNNYRANGGGGYGMLQGLEVVYSGAESIRDLIRAELARRGSIEPSDVLRENWEIVPEALGDRAFAEMARRGG